MCHKYTGTKCVYTVGLREDRVHFQQLLEYTVLLMLPQTQSSDVQITDIYN